jgi:hypothetical protein
MYDYFVINPHVAEIWKEDRKKWSKEQLEFLDKAVEIFIKELGRKKYE